MGERIKRIIILVVILVLIYIQQATVIHAEGNAAVMTENNKEAGKLDETDGQEGNEGSDPDKEEPAQPPVTQFTVKVPEPDGENGFYVTKPTIMITHKSERGITKYQLFQKGSVLTEGILETKEEQRELSGDVFPEGESYLNIWMEDENGEIIEEFREQKEFQIDTQAPEIQVEAPRGFDAWYQTSVLISAKGIDDCSQIKKLMCYVNGKFIGEKEKEKGEFEISEASSGGKAIEVTIIAEDRAGNKSSRIKSLYIDNSAPKVMISGVEEYMITSSPLTVTYEIQEDNILNEFSAFADWENVQGQKSVLPVSEWEKTKIGRKTTQTLSEDGIYQFYMHAADKAGYQTERKVQVIIDKENPMIQYVEELDGKYLQDFYWEKVPDKLVQDFTTFAYEIRMDGNLYTTGKKIRAEGSHILEVSAKDAAGNTACAKAKFIVDRTPPKIIFSDVEEGKEYEEKHTFRISLGNAEDAIRQIQINGENQKIRAGSKSVQYTVQECKNYEIRVKAADKAGNLSEKRLFFSVVPQKTLFQKASEPVVKILTGGKENKEEHTEKAYEEKFPIAAVLIIAFIILVTVVGVMLWYYWKKKSS